MSTTKAIPGIQKGPDFDREAKEVFKIEEVDKATKLKRSVEVNDPIVSAAVDAANEMSNILQRKIEVQYETHSQTVIMTVYSADGEKVISRVPPEEVIRLSQRLKEDRSQQFDSIL